MSVETLENDDFLNGVPGFEDSDDVNTQTASPTEETQSPETQESTSQPTGTQDSDASKPDGSKEYQQSGSQGGGNLKHDARGNIVDQDGRIVASAGGERRLWEKNQQLMAELNNAQKKVIELSNAQEQLQGLGKTAASMGLSDTDAAAALQLFVSLKQDPVSVAKNLLTHLRAAGHNIDEFQSTVDVNAISRLVEEKLRPITERFEQEKQAVEVNTKIDQQVTEFFNNNPDGIVHSQEIANLLNADPNLSLDAAYFKLKAYAYENGYDWTQPLSDQILARRNGSQGATETQVNLGERKPLAGANGAVHNRMVDQQGGTDYIASADTSIEDIVRSALRDSGYSG